MAQAEKPRLFIASDELPKVLPQFQQFAPLTAADLGVEMPQAPFYPDYYTLTQCDVLAISNSSFSFSASMLNERAKVFVRPSKLAGGMVAYDPWNAMPMIEDGGITDADAFYTSTFESVSAAVTG